MKKSFVVLTAMAFVVALGLPAMAEVEIYGSIDKEKSKYVEENVYITKDHQIGVKQVVKPSNSAEAQAVKNDINQGNHIDEVVIPGTEGTPAEGHYNDITHEWIETKPAIPGTPDTPANKNATIDGGSLDTASGIIGVNQSPGSINNQGNALAASYSAGSQPIKEVTGEGETRFVGGAFLHAESSAEKINTENSVNADQTTRTNTIGDALKGISGVAAVNQSAGNMNNQNNAGGISIGAAVASLSEADLGLVNVCNVSYELATVTTDTLTGAALSGASGIVGVNQSSGCMNNQANVVAICATSAP